MGANLTQKARKKVFGKVILLPWRNERQHGRIETIDPHADKPALFDAALFGQGDDLAAAHLHRAQLRDVVRLCDGDRHGQASADMTFAQRRKVHIGERVRARDDKRLVQELLRRLDRPGGAERRALDKIAHARAQRAPVAEIALDNLGQIAQRDRDVRYLCRDKPLDDILHHRLAVHFDHRLGDDVRQRAQPAPPAACENYRFHNLQFIAPFVKIFAIARQRVAFCARVSYNVDTLLFRSTL